MLELSARSSVLHRSLHVIQLYILLKFKCKYNVAKVLPGDPLYLHNIQIFLSNNTIIKRNEVTRWRPPWTSAARWRGILCITQSLGVCYLPTYKWQVSSPQSLFIMCWEDSEHCLHSNEASRPSPVPRLFWSCNRLLWHPALQQCLSD